MYRERENGGKVVESSYHPSKEGWVTKKEKNAGRMIMRFLRLRLGILYHYTDPKWPPTWSIILYRTKVRTNPRDKMVRVRSREREITFYCKDLNDFREWAMRLDASKYIRLDRFYDIDGFVTRGAFGTIRKATNKQTSARVAVKQVSFMMLNKYEQRLFRNEIRIMTELRHDNLMHAFDVFETRRDVHIAMPLMENGSLYALQLKRGNFPEFFTRMCIRAVLKGLKHLHDNNIVHRDIKPSNILCHNIDVNPVIK
eukprot:IDg12006t1